MGLKINWAKVVVVLVVVCITAAGWWLISGPHQTEGFGIFLVDKNELVISDREIIVYNGSSHEIILTEKGTTKIENLSSRVSLDGIAFVLRIKGENIYGGMFWSPISSLPCSEVVIQTLVRNNSIQIAAGYPHSAFQGEDPRNNSTIFNYFKSVGKLAN